MRTSTNIVLQIAAVAAAVGLRLARPGWMLIAAVLLVVPVLGIGLPLVLALATAHRDRLPRWVAVPFVSAAATLVVAAATLPETDDATGWVPLLEVLGLPQPPDTSIADLVGTLAVCGFVGALVWTGVALAATRAHR